VFFVCTGSCFFLVGGLYVCVDPFSSVDRHRVRSRLVFPNQFKSFSRLSIALFLFTSNSVSDEFAVTGGRSLGPELSPGTLFPRVCIHGVCWRFNPTLPPQSLSMPLPEVGLRR